MYAGGGGFFSSVKCLSVVCEFNKKVHLTVWFFCRTVIQSTARVLSYYASATSFGFGGYVWASVLGPCGSTSSLWASVRNYTHN